MAVTEADGPGDGLIADRCRLVERMGGGSTAVGEVWLAHDVRLDRTVVVRRLPPGAARQSGETAMRADG